jgi:hypothetical protein
MSIKNGTPRIWLVTQTLRGQRKFAAILMTAIAALLIIPVTLTLGTQKAQTAPPEEKKASSCSKPMGVTLPLNLSRRPAPPTRAPFLGLSSTTLGEIGGSSQWCWSISCEHWKWTCSEGTARDEGGCCVTCCNEFGCSDPGCCPGYNIE